jgi:hypothetical protein
MGRVPGRVPSRVPSPCLQIPCFEEDAEFGTQDLEPVRESTIVKIIATINKTVRATEVLCQIEQHPKATAEIPRDFLLAMKIDLTETSAFTSQEYVTERPKSSPDAIPLAKGVFQHPVQRCISGHETKAHSTLPKSKRCAALSPQPKS